jgi:ribonuclease III
MTPAAALAERLGLPFDDLALLDEALVHSSYLHERPAIGQSNQRLEFLGDAVISLIVSEELWRRHPKEDEGSLTTRRAAVVSARGLARIAQRLDLGSYLLLGQGADAAGERTRKSVLAATFEAVVGAVYLEFGFARARDWLLEVAEPELAQRPDPEALKPAKSVLQETSYARTGHAPVYRLLREDGPAHARHYTVEVLVDGEALGRGQGRNRREAETEAATAAIAELARRRADDGLAAAGGAAEAAE